MSRLVIADLRVSSRFQGKQLHYLMGECQI